MVFKKKKRSSALYENPEALFRDRRNRTVQGLLSHQSDMLRRYKDEAFEKSNVALELPTGSGKTLVGLLIAEFRRATQNERVLYLCPTNQLVLQVCEQSERKYGITATPFVGKIKNFDPSSKTSYQTGKTIAVAPYSALFNTNPFFESPQVIILDDAHAAENYIAKTWSLNISRHDHKLIYFGILDIIKIFLPDLERQRFYSSDPDRSRWIEKIPAAYFTEILPNIYAFLNENIAAKSDLSWPWSFLQNNLNACHLYVSYKQILIRPYIPPSLSHAPFANATQRIFMSATLGLGGDLERITGIPSFHRLAMPDGWDKQGIGRRYFIFPEMSLPTDELDSLTKAMVERAGRALILVPNDDKANRYKGAFKDLSVYSAKDIESSKDNFVKDKGVAVLANRYDGIDLLDDDCRLLIIEGLPKAGNLQELFFVTRMLAGNLFKDRIRTRIIQAFGRCTRSATDYAAVVVIGQDFHDWLVLQEKRSLFHPELQGELIFGIEQSEGTSHEEFLENLNIFLDHGHDWDEVDDQILEYRDEASQQQIPGQDKLFEAARQEVEYSYALWNEDYEKCLDIAQNVAGILSGDDLKGLRGFWSYLAASAAELAFQKLETPAFMTKAIDLYRRSSACLPAIDWLRVISARLANDTNAPESDIDFFLESNIERMESVFEASSFASPQKFESAVRDILEGLESSDSNIFEEAHRRLGEILGFTAGNSSAQATPDPWWISDGKLCLVFEDKSDSDPAHPVPVKHARQAASHHKWITDNVSLDSNAEIHTVMITTQSKIHRDVVTFADQVGWWYIENFRVWAREAISVLRELRSIFTGAGQPRWRDAAREKLLRNSLDPRSIVVQGTQKLLKDLDIE
jgi:hypothetical protein